MRLIDLLNAWNREKQVYVCNVDGKKQHFVAEKDFAKNNFPSVEVVKFVEDSSGDLFVYTDSFDEAEEQEREPKEDSEMFSNLPIGTEFLFMNHKLVKAQLSHAFNETSKCGFAFEPDKSLVWKFDFDHEVEVLKQ